MAALISAAKSGDVDKVKTLLEQGGHPVDYCDDEYGMTSLHWASSKGHLDVVRVLVKFKANVNFSGYLWNEKNPLHFACEKGHLSIVRALVSEFQADLTMMDGCGQTPLHYASGKGHVELVKVLVSEFKVDPNVRDKIDGCTPLHCACKKGHLDVVRMLLSEFKANLSILDIVGQTPLMSAVSGGHEDIVLALLHDFECDPEVCDRQGNTLLHYACARRNVDLVYALVHDYKADVNVCNKNMDTPLHLAAGAGAFDTDLFVLMKLSDRAEKNVLGDNGNRVLQELVEGDAVKMVHILMDGGKVVFNLYNKQTDTPLHVAFKAGNYEVVLTLIGYVNCDLNMANKNGRTLLHLACKGNYSGFEGTHGMASSSTANPFCAAFTAGKIKIAHTLIGDPRCNLTKRDPNGMTALHLACESGFLDVVNALTRHKADVNAYSKLVGTPLHVAFRARKYKVLLSLMSDPSCNPYIKDQYGQTVLHLACKTGNIDLVNALLHTHKMDVNALNEHKKTPLHVALGSYQRKVALALIKEHGCDTNVATSQQITPLHYACKCGDVDLVQALILHKANVNAYSKVGTPLHLAFSAGEEVLLSLMSDSSCNPYIKDQDGQTVLHLACKAGNIDLVNALLHTQKMNVDALNEHKETPLHVAVASSQYEVVLTLLKDHGCDPNVVNSQRKTPLHYACKCGDVNLIQALILHKANANAYSELVGTPLHVAFRAGKYEALLSLMSDPSCDPYMKDQDGQTVLHLACKAGNIDLVNTLFHTYKMDVNAHNENNETPLHVAVASNQHQVAFALIKEHGCDIITLDRNKKTVLHVACKQGATDLVHALIHDMTDFNVFTDKNDTPLHMAAWGGHYDVVLALVSDARCDPSARGYLERTALHVAAYWGHCKIVEELLKYTSPLVVDKFGNTPLHLASQNSHVSTVQHLLHDNAPVLARNAKGFTPRDLARGKCGRMIEEYIRMNRKQLQSHYTTVLELAEKKYSGSHRITRILVVGNPGAGKSSFIESLKREGFFESFSKVSESTVPPHTAGIIPSVHMSSQYGRVLFYDFAGDAEYYSSHAAIFESLASSRKGDNIFIVVVDLREDSATLDTTLHYWFSFIQYQKFKEKPYLIVVGGHLDQSVDKSESLDEFCTAMQPNVHDIKHFMLDCRDPRSNQIAQFKRLVLAWVSESQKYKLSSEARLLLGLLEKDFSAVTACPVQTLVSHIKDCGGWLPVEPKPLHQILLELHEVGVLLLLGDCTKDTDHVVLNISKLTNEVHELLFSESALSSIRKKAVRLISAPHCNVGILPESILDKTLPQYITNECLVHLQYCQQINHSDIGFFPSFAQEDVTSQSFLFFPALCSADKGNVSWDESTGHSFNIGWLALCTDLHDYFPPRFLHVLLLRLVHRFTLSVPAELQTAHASPEHSRRCTMWKKGVYWKMEEGVHCMVELVNGSKGVVVLTKSSVDGAEDCVQVFSDVVSCVMEAKIEFCDSAKPEFYLLDSGADGNYLNGDYLFAVSDVKRALENPQGKRMILSVSGDREMKLSKIQALHKLTYWNNLFPITGHEVLLILEEIGIKIFNLGLSLGASWTFLESLEVDFPSDISQRRIRLVSWWMKSSSTPPCWYTLTEALIDIEMKVLADKVHEKYSLHIQLQEKMLSKRTRVKKTEQTLNREIETDETEMPRKETEAEETDKMPSRVTETEKAEKVLSRETEANKPDEEFLHAFSGVVGSRWPSLAVSLALTTREIEELKVKVWLSQQELALQMLKIWASKEEATYGQLCRKLKTITLFHYSS